MTVRYFVGRDPDTDTFKMRVSKPGFNARTTTDLRNLLLHEGTPGLTAAVSAVVSVPAGSPNSGGGVDPSWVNVNLGRTYTNMPKIILRCNQNWLPSYFSYYCALNLSTGVLTLYNRTSTALSIRYAVFGPL